VEVALAAVVAVSAMGLSSCAEAPTLKVTTVVSGLGIPWDLTFARAGSGAEHLEQLVGWHDLELVEGAARGVAVGPPPLEPGAVAEPA
jgi:hypothetical protein